MRNSIFLLCACFGSGGRHLATPIPVEGKLATTITPEGLPSGNHNFSLPSSVVDFEQGGRGKGDMFDTGEGAEKNQTGQDGKEEKLWTWPKMHWRDSRKGKKVNTLGGGQAPTIRIKDLLWVEGESRIMVEASVQPPIPLITQWTLAYTQVLCLGKLSLVAVPCIL